MDGDRRYCETLGDSIFAGFEWFGRNETSGLDEKREKNKLFIDLR